MGPAGPAGRDGINGTNGSVGPTGPSISGGITGTTAGFSGLITANGGITKTQMSATDGSKKENKQQKPFIKSILKVCLAYMK